MGGKMQALQAWCKYMSREYRDVSVTNMSSSWKSGLAFCAIIHRHRPDLIDYDSLLKENVYENNQLAFDVAEQELGIAALLDADDMVAMPVPDKLCIVTYVSQYYNYFRDKERKGGPEVKGKVAVKREHPKTPIDSPLALSNRRDHAKRGGGSSEGLDSVEDDPPDSPAAKRSTLGDKCTICGGKVYIMERIIESMKLYHRTCIREKQRSLRSPPRSTITPPPAVIIPPAAAPPVRSDQQHPPQQQHTNLNGRPATATATTTHSSHLPDKQAGRAISRATENHQPHQNQQPQPPPPPQQKVQHAEKRKVASNPFVTADGARKNQDVVEQAERPVKKPFLATIKKAEVIRPPWESDNSPAKASLLHSTPTPIKPFSSNCERNTRLSGIEQSQKDPSSVFHRPFMPKEPVDNKDTVERNRIARNAFLKSDTEKTDKLKVDTRSTAGEHSKPLWISSGATTTITTSSISSSSLSSPPSSPSSSSSSSLSSHQYTTRTTTASSSRPVTTTTVTATSRPVFSSSQIAKPLTPNVDPKEVKPKVEVVATSTVTEPPPPTSVNFCGKGPSNTKTFHSLLDNLANVRAQHIGKSESNELNEHGVKNDDVMKAPATTVNHSVTPPPLPASVPPTKAVSSTMDIAKSVGPKAGVVDESSKVNGSKHHFVPPSSSPALQKKEPRKPILKAHEDLTPSSQHKSILKHDDTKADQDRCAPKSILKSALSSSSCSASPKPILKSSSSSTEITQSCSRHASPKSILKPHEHESNGGESGGGALRRSSVDSILKPVPPRSYSPVAAKKSILKSSLSQDPVTEHSGGVHQPTPSGSSSSSNSRFNAFTLNDSVALLLGEEQTTTAASRPAAQLKKSTWQIEFEARQGIRQKEPKAGIGFERNQKQLAADQIQQQRHTDSGKTTKNLDGNKTTLNLGGKTKSKNVEGTMESKNVEGKMEWQMEAEKRAAMRAGTYIDPKLRGRDPVKEGLWITDRLVKTSPNTQGRLVSPAHAQDMELATAGQEAGKWQGYNVDRARKSRSKSPSRHGYGLEVNMGSGAETTVDRMKGPAMKYVQKYVPLSNQRHNPTVAPPTSSPRVPASNDSPRSPASNDSPRRTAYNDSPISTASNVSPRRTAYNDSPRSTASNVSPRSTASNVSPISTASNVSPRSTASIDSPRSTTSKDSPRSTASKDSPRSPASSDSPRSPASSDSPRRTAYNDSPRSTASNDSPRSTASIDSPRSTAYKYSPRSPASKGSPRCTGSNDSTNTDLKMHTSPHSDLTIDDSVVVSPRALSPAAGNNGRRDVSPKPAVKQNSHSVLPALTEKDTIQQQNENHRPGNVTVGNSKFYATYDAPLQPKPALQKEKHVNGNAAHHVASTKAVEAVFKSASKPDRKADDHDDLDELNQLLLNADPDPFGRTNLQFSGQKKITRSPAFKISPTSSPKSSPPPIHTQIQHSPNATIQEPKVQLRRSGEEPRKTEWQLEAERRQNARQGVYVHPKKPAPLPTSPPPSSSPPYPPRRKIMPNKPFRFSFTSQTSTEDEHTVASSPDTPTAPPRKHKQLKAWIQARPLPSPPKQTEEVSPPKRKVNADQRLSMSVILEQLGTLDLHLQKLESQGRVLEQKIRSASDEVMDEDVLMVEWFELVNEKNELVRHESDLMYKHRQQEYEDRHEEVEFELRLLMAKPEYLWTSSDKVRERSLLQELQDVVNLRNNIVDSQEEDRIRYLEEDQEIEGKMAARVFREETPSPKKKEAKKKKNKHKKKNKKERAKLTSPPPQSPLEIDEYSADTIDNRTFCFKISQGSTGC